MGEWMVRDPAAAASHAFQTKFKVTDHSANPLHFERFDDSAALVEEAARLGATTWADYGCGAGGLLARVDAFAIKWGVDFWVGAAELGASRGLTIKVVDIEAGGVGDATPSDLASATEFLEHIGDPHGFLRDVPCRWFVGSVPFHETSSSFDPAHLWVWDTDGYRAMVEGAGFRVIRHTWRGLGQHILAERLPE